MITHLSFLFLWDFPITNMAEQGTKYKSVRICFLNEYFEKDASSWLQASINASSKYLNNHKRVRKGRGRLMSNSLCNWFYDNDET